MERFLFCLCFLRVGMGVGAMKKAFVLIGYRGRGPRGTGRPSLGKGRNPVSETPHEETGICPPPYSDPEKRWVPLRSLGRERRWLQHPGEVSLGLPAAGGDRAWPRGRAAWIGCGSRPTAHELVSTRPSRPGQSRTLSSRAPRDAQLSHARVRALPEWTEGS